MDTRHLWFLGKLVGTAVILMMAIAVWVMPLDRMALLYANYSWAMLIARLIFTGVLTLVLVKWWRE